MPIIFIYKIAWAIRFFMKIRRVIELRLFSPYTYKTKKYLFDGHTTAMASHYSYKFHTADCADVQKNLLI